jgi:hypothetical protein
VIDVVVVDGDADFPSVTSIAMSAESMGVEFTLDKSPEGKNRVTMRNYGVIIDSVMRLAVSWDALLEKSKQMLIDAGDPPDEEGVVFTIFEHEDSVVIGFGEKRVKSLVLTVDEAELLGKSILATALAVEARRKEQSDGTGSGEDGPIEA